MKKEDEIEKGKHLWAMRNKKLKETRSGDSEQSALNSQIQEWCKIEEEEKWRQDK